MTTYLWLKAFHIIAMVAWFSGLFYLPRLFVYHTQTTEGTAEYQRFCTMEQKLSRLIMMPAATITLILGFALIGYYPTTSIHSMGWLHAKIALVVVLLGYHIQCGRYLRQFSANNNQKSERFFRFFNEIPTLLLVGIVLLVVLKPF